MGTDIHCFLEQKSEHRDAWVGRAHIYIPRDYLLFALIAGVRKRDLRWEDQPSFDPQGLPEDVSCQVEDAYTLWVTPESENDCDDMCTLVQAKEWLAEGVSDVWAEDEDGTILRITHPDVHTPSWLTTQQVATLCARYQAAASDSPIYSSLKLLLGVQHLMQNLDTPETPCRLTFWFN